MIAINDTHISSSVSNEPQSVYLSLVSKHWSFLQEDKHQLIFNKLEPCEKVQLHGCPGIEREREREKKKACLSDGCRQE